MDNNKMLRAYKYIRDYETLPENAYTLDKLTGKIIKMTRGSGKRQYIEQMPLNKTPLQFKEELNKEMGVNEEMLEAFEMGSIYWSAGDEIGLLHYSAVNKIIADLQMERRGEMEIKADVFTIDDKKIVKGNASVTIGNMLKIDNLTIMKRKDGQLWVQFPQKQNLPKEFEGTTEVAFPVTSEMREKIITTVLDEYNAVKEAEKNFDVSVYPVENGKGLLANARVILDKEFAIDGFKLAKSGEKDNVVVYFPQKEYKDKDGNIKHKEIVHSASPGMRERIKNEIVKEYNKQVDAEEQLAAETNFKKDQIQQMDSEPMTYEESPEKEQNDPKEKTKEKKREEEISM